MENFEQGVNSSDPEMVGVVDVTNVASENRDEFVQSAHGVISAEGAVMRSEQKALEERMQRNLTLGVTVPLAAAGATFGTPLAGIAFAAAGVGKAAYHGIKAERALSKAEDAQEMYEERVSETREKVLPPDEIDIETARQEAERAGVEIVRPEDVK